MYPLNIARAAVVLQALVTGFMRGLLLHCTNVQHKSHIKKVHRKLVEVGIGVPKTTELGVEVTMCKQQAYRDSPISISLVHAMLFHYLVSTSASPAMMHKDIMYKWKDVG